MRIHASVLAGVFTIAILGVGGCVPRSSRDSYERCFVAADCATSSDRCLTVVNGSNSDSMCSSSCSGPSAFCPRDWMGVAGDCRDIGTGSFNCYQACRNDGDCLSGFQCLTPGVGGASICLPGVGVTTVPAYESCNSATCDGTTQGCFGITDPGAGMTNICTSSCFSDNDCPFDQRGGRGACLDLSGGSNGLCIERCNTSSDCNFDAVCADRTASGFRLDVFVCLPG